MRCEAELCAMWTGDGCICAVLDIAPTRRYDADEIAAMDHYAAENEGEL